MFQFQLKTLDVCADAVHCHACLLWCQALSAAQGQTNWQPTAWSIGLSKSKGLTFGPSKVLRINDKFVLRKFTMVNLYAKHTCQSVERIISWTIYYSGILPASYTFASHKGSLLWRPTHLDLRPKPSNFCLPDDLFVSVTINWDHACSVQAAKWPSSFFDWKVWRKTAGPAPTSPILHQRKKGRYNECPFPIASIMFVLLGAIHVTMRS